MEKHALTGTCSSLECFACIFYVYDYIILINCLGGGDTEYEFFSVEAREKIPSGYSVSNCV